MRLQGHRTFKYIHKNSIKYYGKLMDFKIAKSSPQILLSHKIYKFTNNFKLAITISKKVSKKSVVRNKIRRMLQENFLKNFKQEYNHIPCWVLVNLKSGSFFNYEA